MSRKINKKELIFIATSVTLLIILFGFIFNSANFIIKKINDALTLKPGQDQQLVKFDIEGLKNLGIIK